MIHGYKQGTNIAAGTRQRITCVSTGGNPPATLTWYKNDKKVSSVLKVVMIMYAGLSHYHKFKK